jgi:signal transduction histidine kinase
MRLAPFIVANTPPILEEWDVFARSLDAGAEMTALALRDHAEGILRAIARDMQAAQSPEQQADKSKGEGGADGAASDQLDRASASHGVGRVGSGFDIVEVVSEYRALRATVLHLWRQSGPKLDLEDIDDVTRFNEAMDQSLATAVDSYSRRVDEARRMFLAILGHDLRNPLQCIRMAAFVVSRKAQDTDCAEAVSIIEANTDAMTQLIRDLMDFASTGLGDAMPISRERIDLQRLCLDVVESCRSMQPARTLNFRPSGDLVGDWDPGRLRQVLTNLIGNAFEHGAADEPVELAVVAAGANAILRVHNQGPPIPSDLLPSIFEPLVRRSTLEPAEGSVSDSVGLGLYIVRQIVVAHGGSIEVDSGEQGTTFTIRLPIRGSDGKGEAAR